MIFPLNNCKPGLRSVLSGLLIFVLCFFSLIGKGQDIPKATGFVMDQAGLFSAEQTQQLERALQVLSDSTSNQIAVYTTLDLQGYDKADVALKYLRENAVGQQKTNNGVVILIKPKNESGKGEVFIEVGYGLEGAIPDALAKRVIENEMIPAFKQGNYYAGVEAAVVTLSKLATGEIKAAAYAKKTKGKNTPGGIIILVIVGVFIFMAMSGNRQYAGRNNLPFWMALGLFSSIGSRHGGSWNGFSGGSGGGGGFGGFGGGSGGGGGAGGSW